MRAGLQGWLLYRLCSHLLQVAKAVSQALNRCVNCLPGQRDVDAAIRMVGEGSKRLLSDSVSSAWG